MNWIRRMLQKRSLGPNDVFGSGWKSLSGGYVGQAQAAGLTAFHRAVQLIAGTVSTLPVHVYRRDGDRDALDSKHPLQKVIYMAPNQRMTPCVFWHTVLEHLLQHGNAFIEVVRDQRGRVIELWPLLPTQVRVEVAPDGRPIYKYTPNSAEAISLGPDRVMHIAGPGYDGAVGASVLGQFARVLSIASAMDEFSNAFWRNGAQVGSVLEHPGAMSAEAAQRLIDGFNEKYCGASNAGRAVLLQEGMKLNRLEPDLDRSALIEQRTWAVREVARIFGIPPHMLGDLEKSSYASVEAQNLEFLQFSLRPWIVRLEQAADRSLFAGREAGQYRVRWTVDGLLRASTSVRYAAYATARQNGWLSINEIRRLEDLAPIEGGDQYLTPLNMAPVGQEVEADDE